jgi:hypothetical protein
VKAAVGDIDDMRGQAYMRRAATGQGAVKPARRSKWPAAAARRSFDTSCGLNHFPRPDRARRFRRDSRSNAFDIKALKDG